MAKIEAEVEWDLFSGHGVYCYCFYIAKYCDKRVYLSVCLSVCLTICPLTYLGNHTSKLHEIFCTCRGSVLWRQWNTLCISGFVDDVMYGSYGVWHWQCLCERRAGARSDKFPTYSPGWATLFDFVVVYNVSKLRTCCVIDDTRDPAIGWWRAACGTKAGGEVCCLRLLYY